jgi:hypothetical protein
MSPEFEAWKAQADHLPECEAEFQKWLFVHIASVLFADKAGELLMLRGEKFGLSIDQQIECIAALSPSWKYSYVVLCRDSSCARVVIYDPAKVQKTLAEVPLWVFDKIGYPRDIGPTEFLEDVGRRWQNKGRIPHEIGFCIGYPIKDVLGYMGLIPLPCTGACGWRIYGNPKPSILRSSKFRQAREKAVAFLSM